VKGVATVGDVTDEEQVKAAIAKAEAAHGVARVLMNCAGIGGSQRIIGKDGTYPLAKFARIINVNLIGTFNVLRLFSERLVPAPTVGEERGVIINTASIAAFEGQIGQVAYTASKGAVIAMTKVAALEHAQDGIRVNAICPGPVRSPMSEREGDASVDVTPLRRRAEPSEISAAVAFLASDDAVYVTGADLAVDGGYLAR